MHSINGHPQPSKCIAPECYFASSNSDVIYGKILCSLFTFESYFDEFIASRHNSICRSKFNCSKQWRTSSYLYQIFSTCLVDKKYTLDPSSWVQNQGLVCKGGFSFVCNSGAGCDFSFGCGCGLVSPVAEDCSRDSDESLIPSTLNGLTLLIQSLRDTCLESLDYSKLLFNWYTNW